LSEVRNYYRDLFSNKDDNLVNINLNELFANKNVTKLDQKQSISNDGPLNISELSKVLKNMQNNKTPGIDGFPSDFYKVFWNKLKYFVLRALNESFLKGELSTTTKQCVITCLPKGDKDRTVLKNWRPYPY